jgi:hypothetical protein
MTVPPNHFTDVGTAHFYLKDQLFPLLLPGYQHLFGRIYQVLDYELEEIFHNCLSCPAAAGSSKLRGRNRSLLASFLDDACHRLAGLSTVLYPIFRPIKVELIVLTCLSRIVVTNHFNELAVARTSFVRHYHTVKGAILCTFSP